MPLIQFLFRNSEKLKRWNHRHVLVSLKCVCVYLCVCAECPAVHQTVLEDAGTSSLSRSHPRGQHQVMLHSIIALLSFFSVFLSSNSFLTAFFIFLSLHTSHTISLFFCQQNVLTITMQFIHVFNLILLSQFLPRSPSVFRKVLLYLLADRDHLYH